MDAAQRDALERDIRRRWDAADHNGAATIALRGYGPELYGFLIAFHRSESDAAEVFAITSERLWRGLPSFEWGSSFRTWAYTIARNSSLKHRRDEKRRRARQVALPEGSDLAAIAAEVRSVTRSYLRTEARTRVAELRDGLPPEDRELLVLRVDKGLSFKELAQVFREEDAPPLDTAGIQKEAARLRKRFQLVKQRLLDAGRRQGLVQRDG